MIHAEGTAETRNSSGGASTGADRARSYAAGLEAAGRIITKNLAVVISLISGASFVVGIISLNALAAGVGVSVSDFNLDTRSIAIVTFGGLLWAIMLLVGAFVLLGGLFYLLFLLEPALNKVRWGHNIFVAAFFAILGITLFLWVTFDYPFDRAVGSATGFWSVLFFFLGLAVAAGCVLVAMSGHHYWLVPLAPLLVLVSAIASAHNAQLWGEAVVEGRWREHVRGDEIIDAEFAPYTLALVLPVSRGWLTIGQATLCVDRIGHHVVVGQNGAVAAITEWDTFVHDDECSIGSLELLMSSTTAVKDASM